MKIFQTQEKSMFEIQIWERKFCIWRCERPKKLKDNGARVKTVLDQSDVVRDLIMEGIDVRSKSTKHLTQNGYSEIVYVLIHIM